MWQCITMFSHCIMVVMIKHQFKDNLELGSYFIITLACAQNEIQPCMKAKVFIDVPNGQNQRQKACCHIDLLSHLDTPGLLQLKHFEALNRNCQMIRPVANNTTI